MKFADDFSAFINFDNCDLSVEPDLIRELAKLEEPALLLHHDSDSSGLHGPWPQIFSSLMPSLQLSDPFELSPTILAICTILRRPFNDISSSASVFLYASTGIPFSSASSVVPDFEEWGRSSPVSDSELPSIPEACREEYSSTAISTLLPPSYTSLPLTPQIYNHRSPSSPSSTSSPSSSVLDLQVGSSSQQLSGHIQQVSPMNRTIENLQKRRSKARRNPVSYQGKRVLSRCKELDEDTLSMGPLSSALINNNTSGTRKVRRWRCSNCSKSFTRQSDVVRHRDFHCLATLNDKGKATKGFGIPCDSCGGLFSRKDSLLRHQQSGKCPDGARSYLNETGTDNNAKRKSR
ncbi:hypothetical protein D9756_000236 [Leucocoprinus leucothites]|uniref:C2H2-type domain-containing protein n=1 Tax=Leucocoprinus leucothites TaxID=201217 RepID=A0A8H5GF85_9AGAR|nr:hypothetical protein D9756_000236 [Leucoagaricus leucothites]